MMPLMDMMVYSRQKQRQKLQSALAKVHASEHDSSQGVTRKYVRVRDDTVLVMSL